MEPPSYVLFILRLCQRGLPSPTLFLILPSHSSKTVLPAPSIPGSDRKNQCGWEPNKSWDVAIQTRLTAELVLLTTPLSWGTRTGHSSSVVSVPASETQGWFWYCALPHTPPLPVLPVLWGFHIGFCENYSEQCLGHSEHII